MCADGREISPWLGVIIPGEVNGLAPMVGFHIIGFYFLDDIYSSSLSKIN